MKKILKFEVAIEYESESDDLPFPNLVMNLRHAIEHQRQESMLTAGLDVSANWLTVKFLEERHVPKKARRWNLVVNMDTDDDAELFYEGGSYGMFGTSGGTLSINRHFLDRTTAINALRSVGVVYGGKASEFTYEWLQNAAAKLVDGDEVESVCGNQSYSVSLKEVEVTV